MNNRLPFTSTPNPPEVNMSHVIEYLPPERWKGAPIPLEYTTESYYDIAVKRTPTGYDIPIVKRCFDAPVTHAQAEYDYPDGLYQDWWEGAEAYGIVEDGALLAAIELCPETWSKRMMVTELWIAPELRRQGWGRRLIDLAKRKTVEADCRALILETQSCNVNAVEFYLHMGFELIGFDTCCYTNRDVERREVRFNMGWFPNGNEAKPE